MACFDTVVPPDRCPTWPGGSPCRAELHDAGVRRLRVPRPVLRVHRRGAAAVRSPGPAAGRIDRRAPGQRREPVRDRRPGASVATTMGFTALDGLPMGTRCGALDPGVPALPDRAAGMDARRHRAPALQRVRAARASRASPATCGRCSASADPSARAQAIDCLRLPHRAGDRARWRRRSAGSTRSCSPAASARTPPTIRERVCRDAAWLGVELAAGGERGRWPANQHTRTAGSSAWVVPTNEELMIARHTQRVLDHA